MTVATQSDRRENNSYLERPRSSSLADVMEIILDKGLVLDAYVRVSLVGIEILTIDARVVIASVDTYLRFAEATNRLDLYEKGGKDLSEVVGDSAEEGAKGKASGAIEGVKKAVTGDDDDGDDDDDQKQASSRSRSSSGSSSSRRREGSRGGHKAS